MQRSAVRDPGPSETRLLHITSGIPPLTLTRAALQSLLSSKATISSATSRSWSQLDFLYVASSPFPSLLIPSPPRIFSCLAQLERRRRKSDFPLASSHPSLYRCGFSARRLSRGEWPLLVDGHLSSHDGNRTRNGYSEGNGTCLAGYCSGKCSIVFFFFWFFVFWFVHLPVWSSASMMREARHGKLFLREVSFARRRALRPTPHRSPVGNTLPLCASPPSSLDALDVEPINCSVYRRRSLLNHERCMRPPLSMFQFNIVLGGRGYSCRVKSSPRPFLRPCALPSAEPKPPCHP